MEVASYVSLNRVILKLVGLYPKSIKRILTVVLFMLLIVVPQVLQIYHSRDLSVILETSSVLLTIILALLKIIVWAGNGNEMNDLINYMFGIYWNMIDFGDETADSFLRYAAFSKTFTKLYLFLVLNALLFFYGLPLIHISVSKINDSPEIDKNSPMLFPGMYPEGWTEFPFYQMAIFSQILATCSCAAVVVAIDSLIATALFHTCGHLKIVQKNLRSIGDDVNHMVESMGDQRLQESLKNLVRIKLGACIKHHQVILRFSATMERLFNPIMLCQVLASNMIICLVGLQVSSNLSLSDEGRLFKYFAYLLMALFQLMLFCLPGDDLASQSLLVSEAAYSTNWESISKLFANDLKFIIRRGQKPAKITAGKFTVMSLEHFATVLSTSVSYFTVLRSLS